MKALLIVCAFNEGVKLEETAARIYSFLQTRRSGQPPIEVLFVDDGSTDNIPGRLAAQYHFHYLRNGDRRGIGASIRTGYQYGLERGYSILIMMAGNNKDNPDELDRLIEPISSGKADFVQGSRYLSGGGFGNMPGYRLFATRLAHPGLFSIVSGKKITDSTNGFRAIRASMLRDIRIQLNQEWLNQYELEPYLFYKAVRLGYRVLEVPVTKIYPDKKLGYSKMKPITGWWSILRPLVYLGLGIKK